MALTGEELGAVEAAGFDADEDLVCLWGGDGKGLDFEDFGAAGGVNYGRFHHGGGHFGGRGADLGMDGAGEGEEVFKGGCQGFWGLNWDEYGLT